jgi:fructose-1,6-bisphosphatase/inositol monophosphatase family enzyme
MPRRLTSSPRTVALDLAHSAGSIIKSSLKLGIARTWKADHTPVTVIDQQINDLVIATIHAHFPTHSILAEEGSDLTRSKEFVWVCDPLDGTFPFMHGIPVSTFTLALVQGGQPILGVICDPFTGRLFLAEKGQGATLNDRAIHASPTTTLNDASIGVIFWKGNMPIFTPLLAKLAERGGKIFDLASVAYMDALLAAGEFAAVIFPGESAHDSAAAKIIVEEAGGVFTSLTGVVDRYDQPVHGHLAAGNREIYDQISSLLR